MKTNKPEFNNPNASVYEKSQVGIAFGTGINESVIQPDKKERHHLYDYISPIEHEPKKILTKPAIIRLKCKTRYNESKIVNHMFNKI